MSCLAKITSYSESEEIISSCIVTLAAIVNSEAYVHVLAKSMFSIVYSVTVMCYVL